MNIEPTTVEEALSRLRRVEGQIGGIIRMIEEGRDCEDVVTQLAAASKALDRAGFKIVMSGMRRCLEVESDEAFSETQIARMEKLFLSLA